MSDVFLKRLLGRELEDPVFLVLPRIAAATELSKHLVGPVEKHSNIVIDARRSALQAESFAYQLLSDMLATEPVEIVALGGSNEWFRYLKEAAAEYEVEITFLSLDSQFATK